ncbi:hypothetical protein EIP86_008334 [Pleurotus ostreatoroseus]|nr:hypothetical protein EIP86_008334 [Pleurotus ostreatoroseus]
MPALTDLPSFLVRKLFDYAQTVLAPQDADEITQAISEVKAKHKDIFDSPRDYVQKIKAHLYPRYTNADGVFDDFKEFMFTMEVRRLEQHTDILTILVENGLHETIVDFIFRPAFWEAYDEKQLSYHQFMSFLTWAGYLLRTTVPQEGPSIVTPFVTALLTEHATALSGLLATFWQRRHDFPNDPDYTPSSRFRGNRDDTFGGAMYSFCLSLDTLAELQGRYVYSTIRPRLYLK